MTLVEVKGLLEPRALVEIEATAVYVTGGQEIRRLKFFWIWSFWSSRLFELLISCRAQTPTS